MLYKDLIMLPLISKIKATPFRGLPRTVGKRIVHEVRYVAIAEVIFQA